MLCIKLDNAYKTLGTLSLYGEISLNVGGSELVAKSCLTLAAPWTVAHQAPLSMGLPRQEYWSGLPFPSPGDPPDPRGWIWVFSIGRWILFRLSHQGSPLNVSHYYPIFIDEVVKGRIICPKSQRWNIDVNPSELSPHVQIIDNERNDKLRVFERRLKCILTSAIFIINPDMCWEREEKSIKLPLKDNLSLPELKHGIFSCTRCKLHNSRGSPFLRQ